MWTALKALQKFAQAKRYYLRGKSPDVLVNIERMRMMGKDTGYASRRSGRPDAEADRERLRRLFASAASALRTSPDSALEILAEDHVEALRQNSAVAKAVGDLETAIRLRKDVAMALARARRTLPEAHADAYSLTGGKGVLDTSRRKSCVTHNPGCRSTAKPSAG